LRRLFFFRTARTFGRRLETKLTRIWEPHSRLVLSWDITADWQYDSSLKTEIEVRFIADGKGRTRVEPEHRHLDRYGARRDEMRTTFDSTGYWGRLLESFASAAA
jgi:uncharacterized protein YndB with AHSA1/START domain